MTDLKDREHRDYFAQVIKEATKMLTKGKSAYVFSQEQVDFIKRMKGFENINVQLNEGIYYLTAK